MQTVEKGHHFEQHSYSDEIYELTAGSDTPYHPSSDTKTLSSNLEKVKSTTSSKHSTLHLLDDPANFPDGWNTTAMVTLLGSFLGMVGSLGFVNSGGVMQSYVSENILTSDSQSAIGWIFSVYNFFAFGGLLISGPLFDKVGCKKPIFVGTILMFGGFFATSFCRELYQFVLAYSILGGIGTSLVFGPFVATLSHFFLKKRALVIGLSYTGGGLGGVLFPVMYRELFPKVGFGWTIRIGSFISLFCCTCGWLIVHDRHEEFHDNKGGNIFKEVMSSIDFKILVRNKLFTVLVTGLLFNGLLFLITIVELPSYARSQGFDDNQAYLLLVVFNSVGIAGRIIPSYIADNGFGRFNTFVVINLVSLIAFTVIWVPFGSHLTALYVFAGVFGFSSGSVLSLSASLIASIVPTKDVGKGLGTGFAILSIGDLIGIPIAGAIATGSSQSFKNLVYFLTACAAVGSSVSFVSRFLYGGINFDRV
ncbi:putative transporter MCH4 [Candida viswanathii]|uniref:Putative transporter MCH4 n=1 Tax=Candida viswanathii TaxID=5486 RepID=A0A367Y1F4_9ASCO|nr:putative transporter MCH4 [Candida viswanathii]